MNSHVVAFAKIPSAYEKSVLARYNRDEAEFLLSACGEDISIIGSHLANQIKALVPGSDMYGEVMDKLTALASYAFCVSS